MLVLKHLEMAAFNNSEAVLVSISRAADKMRGFYTE